MNTAIPGTAHTGGYSIGGCTQYGTYVGNGMHFGANPEYSIYRQDFDGYYVLHAVLDYGCILKDSYKHVLPAASTTTKASSSGSGGPKTFANPSNPAQNNAGAAHTAAVPWYENPVVLAIGAGAGILGVAIAVALWHDGHNGSSA